MNTVTQISRPAGKRKLTESFKALVFSTYLQLRLVVASIGWLQWSASSQSLHMELVI